MIALTAPLWHARTTRHGWWWKGLIAGLALWAATVGTIMATLNANLIPTLILLGSFLVPFCVVLFVMERVNGSIGTTQLMVGFFLGGVLGVLGASLVEYGLTSSIGLFIAVGWIEEFVKIVVVVVIGWRARPRSARVGALIGATIGAGFAAFESAGYAFNAAITAQGIDLSSLVRSEVIRALLAPVGHVLWSAILGAVVFAFLGSGRPVRSAWRVVIAFFAVALLHALWDSMSTIASFFAVLASGHVVTVLRYGALPAQEAGSLASLSLIFYIVGLALTSLMGLGALVYVLTRPGPLRTSHIPLDAAVRIPAHITESNHGV